MARLPVVSGVRYAAIMAKIGFQWDYTQGSHMILLHSDGRRLAVPRHREPGRGLLVALIRNAGLTRDEFLDISSD